MDTDTQFRQNFFTALQSRLEALGIEHRFGTEQEGDMSLPMLRALFSTTGNGEGQITTDMLFFPGDTGAELLQIYSTIALNIRQDALDELFRLCNSLNFLCLTGAFGVYLEGGHVYHKYNVALSPGGDLEKCLDGVEAVLAQIISCIGPYYQLIHSMASGLLTFEEAKNKDLIP